MDNTRKKLKHVSKACLRCRGRHMKCDGQQPVCGRCVDEEAECIYVKSNRGGSRKKGVSRFNKDDSDSSHRLPDLEKQQLDDLMRLPCTKNPDGSLNFGKAASLTCDKDCLNHSTDEIPSCMSQSDTLHPTFNGKQAIDVNQVLFTDKPPRHKRSFTEPITIPSSMIEDLDLEKIIDNYYTLFHDVHPFLPHRVEITDYLNSIPNNYDLILAMKLIGDGQATTIYAKDSESVNFTVLRILNYVKQIGKDFVTLQTLLLLSMVAHISSLHDLSAMLRKNLVDLCLELQLNYLDDSNLIGSMKVDINEFPVNPEDGNHQVVETIVSTPRTSHINKDVLIETIRRTFWECYFFDTISGTANGVSISRLTMIHALIQWPTQPRLEQFDYKSRSRACKLVNDAIRLNVALQEDKEIDSHLTKMKAAIGNWEMQLENPELFETPYLINRSGFVNEGIHQAMMLFNYARIFTHRPFSYLWRPEVELNCDTRSSYKDGKKFARKLEFDSRKIIETRKTIESANSIAKTLLDTSPSNIRKRTPFYACSLAFACLIHLSAYAWVESSIKYFEENEDFDLEDIVKSFDVSELSIYVEYIKLELGGIYSISTHWSLSSKLANHIKETIAKVSPALSATIDPTFIKLNRTSNRQLPVSLENSISTGSSSQLLDSSRPRTAMTTNSIPQSTSLTSNSISASHFQSQMVQPVQDSEFHQEMTSGFDRLISPIYFPSPDSAYSDTGCDWIDKNFLELDNFQV
ncbi:Putative transcription factor [Komagataella phaffii CBS 7435]|uniref:Transcription factor n=2 Tax=Komagataella phaffii TaxID=460519 RepID=C4QVU6_KOMPG|nr:transcription factor [Komagataella phaffii GS115]AOA60505.1 GQ67_02572T0 [Komagataella phaffii]CAH2446028.1 Putative transcription factor [Komagataella phaffii CBS 7435]AOA65434.1 GQ68_02676T0 [Komagataella phaffii GS115]CAY67369.1 transcription factor [Komagataella phaffii GS115]CCA36469.1 Putative transcription factor [Komagataella phaffii CBS 7435]